MSTLCIDPLQNTLSNKKFNIERECGSCNPLLFLTNLDCTLWITSFQETSPFKKVDLGKPNYFLRQSRVALHALLYIYIWSSCHTERAGSSINNVFFSHLAFSIKKCTRYSNDTLYIIHNTLWHDYSLKMFLWWLKCAGFVWSKWFHSEYFYLGTFLINKTCELFSLTLRVWK